MNLIVNNLLHVVSGFALYAGQMTYTEYGAPTVCQFQALSWDGSAWHAQVSGCVSDRVFRGGFDA